MGNQTNNHQKILAIIPARGGSKGVPKKNIKLLNGKPLITYTINAAKQCNCIDRLILSSEDDEIIKIAKGLGVEVPFKRPDYLSKDDTGSLEVVQHAIDFFEKQSNYFDAVVLLQPTTPFRENGFIDRAIRKFTNNNCDALISVQPVPHQYNPHWVFKTKGEEYLEISTKDESIIKRRQNLPKAFFRDGSIYITKTKIIKNGSFYGNKLLYLESSSENFVNIDNLADWKKAEKIAAKLNANVS